jgi:hypothetical protein
MFVERRTRMHRMAALPVPVDSVPAVPSLSLVPAPPKAADPVPVRPRFRRLVVFTGKIN